MVLLRSVSPVVLETGRRRPKSSDILPFHRNVRVAGQASSERATTKTSSEGLSSITRRSHRKQTLITKDTNRRENNLAEKIISRNLQPARADMKSIHRNS